MIRHWGRGTGQDHITEIVLILIVFLYDCVHCVLLYVCGYQELFNGPNIRSCYSTPPAVPCVSLWSVHTCPAVKTELSFPSHTTHTDLNCWQEHWCRVKTRKQQSLQRWSITMSSINLWSYSISITYTAQAVHQNSPTKKRLWSNLWDFISVLILRRKRCLLRKCPTCKF